MTLNLIRKSIGGSRFQKILSLVTIIASTLLISCMLNITLGIGNQIAKDLRSYGSNIVVLPKGTTLSVEVGDEIYAPLQSESYLEESKLHLIKEIFWRNNITAFAPFLDSRVSVGNLSLGIHSAESKISPSLAEGDKGGGLNTQNNGNAKFSNNESTHPLTPSAREGEQVDTNSAREGELKFDSRKSSAIFTGTYFDKVIGVQDEPEFSTGVKMLYPAWSVEGEWVADNSLNSVLVGSELAKRENIKIGDSLILRESSVDSGESSLDSRTKKAQNFNVKVSGILSNSGVYDNRIIGSLALAQRLIGKSDIFAKAEVSAFTIPENTLSYKARRNLDELNDVEYDTWYCSAFASSIAYQIEEDFKGASAKAQIKVSDAESSIVRKIQGLMGVTSIICLLVASVGIGALLSAEFQRRRKEIGLMKVLGANLWQIYAIFAGESCVIAIFGAIIGFFGGVGVAELIAISIFAHALPISWIALPLSIAFALFTSLCGSLMLLKNINALLPANVLYGR